MNVRVRTFLQLQWVEVLDLPDGESWKLPRQLREEVGVVQVWPLQHGIPFLVLDLRHLLILLCCHGNTGTSC